MTATDRDMGRISPVVISTMDNLIRPRQRGSALSPREKLTSALREVESLRRLVRALDSNLELARQQVATERHRRECEMNLAAFAIAKALTGSDPTETERAAAKRALKEWLDSHQPIRHSRI